MPRPSIRTTTNASFVTAFLLLLFIATVAFFKISALATNNEWVIHTHEVREEIQELLSNLIEARSEARAYLATHNPMYLARYHKRSQAVLDSFPRAWQLTADNPSQQQRLQTLHPILLQMLALLDQESATRRLSDERIATLFTAVQTEMDKAQAIVAEMNGEEAGLLNQRNQEVRASSRSALSLVTLGVVLALLIIMAAMWQINTQLAKRQRRDERIAKLNSALHVRAKELSESNRDLEAFTYSISHDLRGPLRRIEGFSKILEEESSARLSDEGRECVALIRENTCEMNQMVEGLLTLDRFTREDLSVQLTGLNSLIDDVVADLKRTHPERAIEWCIERLPFVECDPRLMKHVFCNLLSNAVKFTRLREKAVIQIGAMKHEDETTFFVRDNGVGFNPNKANTLFGVFRRLHRQEDFEGTGVGLAMVQRIVHKHGGRIWAEAKIDEGATFFFTLGRSEDSGTQNTNLDAQVEHERSRILTGKRDRKNVKPMLSALTVREQRLG